MLAGRFRPHRAGSTCVNGYAARITRTGSSRSPWPRPPTQGCLAGGGCLHNHDIDIKTNVQPPNAPAGKFTKDQFIIDLGAATVTCPNGATIAIRPVTGHTRHAGKANFGKACTGRPLRGQCTTSKTGRQITISRWETHLADARVRQRDPDWQADYRATRPKTGGRVG